MSHSTKLYRGAVTSAAVAGQSFDAGNYSFYDQDAVEEEEESKDSTWHQA